MRSTDELVRRRAARPGRRPAHRLEWAARAPKDWCQVPAATQLAVTQPNVTDARCEALFASTLQPSDAATADMVAEAITCTLRRLGIGGCVGQMAQEFGEHPDLAAGRMRWARQLAAKQAAT